MNSSSDVHNSTVLEHPSADSLGAPSVASDGQAGVTTPLNLSLDDTILTQQDGAALATGDRPAGNEISTSVTNG